MSLESQFEQKLFTVLGKALEDITGITPVAKKSVRSEVDFHPLPRSRKRVPERIMDWPDKSGKRVLF